MQLPHPLAHGGPAQHDAFHRDEPRGFSHVNGQRAIERGPVKHNRFLRQPSGVRMGPHDDLIVHHPRRPTWAAIQPLGGLAGRHGGGAVFHRKGGLKPIAAGDTAGGIDKDHFGRPAINLGHPRLDLTLLIKRREPGTAARRPRRESDARNTVGALQPRRWDWHRHRRHVLKPPARLCPVDHGATLKTGSSGWLPLLRAAATEVRHTTAPIRRLGVAVRRERSGEPLPRAPQIT